VQQYVDHIPLLEQLPPVDGMVVVTQYDELERPLNYAMWAGIAGCNSQRGQEKGLQPPEQCKRNTITKKTGCTWPVIA